MARIDPNQRLYAGQEAEDLALKHNPTRAQIDRINAAIEAWAERDPMGYSDHEARRIDERIDDILSTPVIYADELEELTWACSIESVDAGAHTFEQDEEAVGFDNDNERPIFETRFQSYLAGTCLLRAVERPEVTVTIAWTACGGECTFRDAYAFEVEVDEGCNEPFDLSTGDLEVVDEDGDIELEPFWSVQWDIGQRAADSTDWESDVIPHLPAQPGAEDIDNDEDTDMTDTTTHELSRDNAPDVRFRGEQIASASSYSPINGPRNTRWTELTLYRTSGGKLVCSEVGRTQWEGERDRRAVHIAETNNELVEAVGYGRLAKELYDQAGIEHAVTID